MSSDLENMEMSGNFDAGEKVREFFKNKKSKGKVREFRYVKFVFSQSEHPNFENFPGEHSTDPPKQSWTHERVLSLSGKVMNFIPSGNWTSCICTCQSIKMVMIWHTKDLGTNYFTVTYL